MPEGRRRNMRANRSENTGPELTVRRMLHRLGYRYRIHSRDLPGKPDIVFTARRLAIEVRGCFWHGHGCRPLGQLPRSRVEYWGPKISGNRERDLRNKLKLEEQGWSVLELWECDVRGSPGEIERTLRDFLGPTSRSAPSMSAKVDR